LGVVQLLRGRADLALEQFQSHLVIARELGDRHGETTATSRVGAMHFMIGNLGEAIDYTEKSRKLSADGDRERHGINCQNLGEMRRLIGHTEGAEEILKEARAIFLSIGSRRYAAAVANVQGQMSQDAGDFDEATRLHLEALELYRQVRDFRGQARCHIYGGRVRRMTGDTDEAARAFAEAAAIADQIEAPEFDAYAAAQAAPLPGGSVDDARRAMRDYGSRLEFPDEMDAYFALWEAGRNPEDLAKAHEMLTHLRDRTPEEYRESMIENVPLHKAIMEAYGQ
jgi:tetratricopeptide (TPR) repeat protein